MEAVVNRDVRERIWAAADHLYDQAGRGDVLPTVDAVRRQAKANMNDVSLVMKEWRDAQKVAVKTVAIAVPENLVSLGKQVLATFWQTAQEHANESLRAAQAGWDAERTEAAAMLRQVSEAFDAQVEQAQLIDNERDRLRVVNEGLHGRIEQQQERLQQLEKELAGAIAETATANAKADEIASKATELRKELDHAHAQAERLASQAEADRAEQQRRYTDLKQERDDARQAHASERGKLEAMLEAANQSRDEARAERDSARSAAVSERETHSAAISRLDSKIDALTQARADALAERDASRADATAAREAAARLAGELDAVRAQKSDAKKPSKS